MDSVLSWCKMILEQPSMTMHDSLMGTIENKKQYDFEHDSMLQKLPEKLRSGSILIEDGDLFLYLSVYFGSCVGFYLIYLLLRVFFEKIQYGQYLDKSWDERECLLMTWMSQFHHLIVPPFALYNIYYSCQNANGSVFSPIPEPGSSENAGSHTGVTWAWYKEPSCRLEPNKGYVCNTLISIAFMTVEFILITIKIKKPKTMNI